MQFKKSFSDFHGAEIVIFNQHWVRPDMDMDWAFTFIVSSSIHRLITEPNGRSSVGRADWNMWKAKNSRIMRAKEMPEEK